MNHEPSAGPICSQRDGTDIFGSCGQGTRLVFVLRD